MAHEVDEATVFFEEAIDKLRTAHRELRESRAAEARLREALNDLVSEVSAFVKGGDDPHDRCTECGNPGYGMMVDAMMAARKALSASDGGGGRGDG